MTFAHNSCEYNLTQSSSTLLINARSKKKQKNTALTPTCEDLMVLLNKCTCENLPSLLPDQMQSTQTPGGG